ncbi:hypothetical protein B0A52_09160 [Exophiala mesophila]|uniref:SnoaL-like domain-containing protein n=1 Tax=Exophiala mesophila TaxID=212818 RepID=A0A438MUJ1_EXOME|nr:hypothetical protein B0A52_09160 [Exophiala mesophila]
MPNVGGLTDREAAIDAIVRFVCSLDEGSDELCSSAVTDNVVMDLRPFNKVGMKYSVVEGKTDVVNRLMTAVGRPLDTTHSATNIRCYLTGPDTADLTCCVLAQHFRGGEGPSPEFQDYYLFGNQYKAKVVRQGDLWKVSELEIAPAWTQGNPEVMKV